MSALAILLLGAIAYAAVVISTTLLSVPLRQRLVALAAELADEDGRTEAERDHLTWLAASSTSSAVGLLVPAASVFLLATVAVGGAPAPVNPELARLDKDPRYDRLVAYYFASILACSPFAALLSLPGMVAAMMLVAIRGREGIVHAAEAPVLKASQQLRPCPAT